MIFTFSDSIQAGIAAGKYARVFTAGGVPIGIARDVATGRFVGHAIGMGINPLISPVSALLGGMQMYQTHRGFQAVQSALGVLY